MNWILAQIGTEVGRKTKSHVDIITLTNVETMAQWVFTSAYRDIDNYKDMPCKLVGYKNAHREPMYTGGLSIEVMIKLISSLPIWEVGTTDKNQVIEFLKSQKNEDE